MEDYELDTIGSIELRHHLGCELFQTVAGFLKVAAITTDQKMLKADIAGAADIVDDCLGTAGETQTTTVAALQFRADTGIDRE